ncbi:MAG: sigma 54-interacting transcriptional regulator [Archangiaceae bacterium]|nr:sigma 54-interacting transcriptional regulator [Archangiaceae bacterium]
MQESKKTTRIEGESIVRVGEYALVVVSGPNKKARLTLSSRPVLLGTARDCDLVLDDETVSARHCELAPEGEQLVLRDLGSTNGVFVEDVRVREAVVAPGARIRLGRSKLKLEAHGHAELAVLDADHFDRLYGKSRVMRSVFARLAQCARSDAALLIEGETGVGKDLAAEAVHRASARAEGPCVLFDCAAVAPTLLEAELFGWERGAFTGAQGARAGLAEQADGGTLIVDELGELPLELQPKLLRVLERGEVRRLGGEATRKIDVRIIATTNRALAVESQAGRFREDLFFRVSALTVRMPALREHLEDVPGLVDGLLKRGPGNARFDELPESDRQLLLAHRWPGNVRELRNVVERLSAFPKSGARELLSSGPAVAPARSGPLGGFAEERERAHEAFERQYLDEILAQAQSSISEAARLAQVSRQFVQKLMRKHGLR